MKIYRLLLLGIVCVLAFLAGWFLRGNYMVREDSSKKWNPKFVHQPDFEPSAESCKRLFDKNSSSISLKETSPRLKDNSISVSNIKKAPINLKQFKIQTLQDKKREAKQKQYDMENRRYLLSIPYNQVFKLKGKYSFLVNVFSKEEQAVKYIEKLKNKHPLWNFFIKLSHTKTKIYLGPFEDQTKANAFINEIYKKPFPFPNYILEEQDL